MAISGGDGSIILTTKVDQSGLNKGIASMQNGVKSLSSSFKALGSTIAAVFSVTAIINFSKQAGEFATQTEASVQRLIDIYGEASQSVGNFIDANANAIGMSKASAASFASVYGNLFSVWADQATNAELTNRYLNMTAVVASKSGRTVQDVQERIRSGLLGNTEAIEDLGVFVNVKTIEMTDAFKRMADGKSWEQLDAYAQQQVRTMAILEQATSKYGNTVADTTATTRSQYQAAYEDFKNTWGQLVNTVLIPVLKVATQVFNVLTAGLRVIAGISGKTIENTDSLKDQEKIIKNSAGNQEDLKNSVEDTAKANERTLAGFDKVNKLTDSSASGAGGAGGAVGGTGDLNIPDLGGEYDNSFVDKIDADIAAIMGIVGAALVAIGIILICFGHIGWGIGFIIAGASLFAVSQAALSKGSGTKEVKKLMNGIIAGISLLALILGIILVCLCKFPSKGFALGVGLIISGAAGLATVAVINKEAIKQIIDEHSTEITILGVLLVVLGILMCMAGAWALGIGAILGGAGAITYEVVVNWEAIKEKVKEQSGKIAIVGVLLVALGILLCFAQMWGLGVGLIIAGAGTLAGVVALNWNAIKNKISSFIKENSGLFVGVGLALVVLGVILLFTGVGIPLGIGLIVAGAGSLAMAIAPNWNFIVDKVKGAWEAVKAFWNKYIAPIFTADWWLNLGKACINGLIAGFEGGINGIISAFEWLVNVLVKGLNKISIELPEWDILGDNAGKKFGFNLKEVSFNRVSIPRLAKGAVIPPNKEFMAILGDQKHGTNIETPLETMIEAFNVALSQRGDTGSQEIVVYLDGDVVFESVVKKNRQNTMRTGKNALAY